ncbi:MAG: ribonuclease III [Firmicutes bacterium]|nr:ribonuclease III [Bacillota bacterium]
MFKDGETEPGQRSPQVLAYLGDAVYELYIRTKLVEHHSFPVQQLHQKAVKYVQAAAQAQIVHSWEPFLTQEEKDVVRRGRNIKGGVPRGGDTLDYRYSTGFEALLGHLYLSGQGPRLKELLGMIQPAGEQQEE